MFFSLLGREGNDKKNVLDMMQDFLAETENGEITEESVTSFLIWVRIMLILVYRKLNLRRLFTLSLNKNYRIK